MTTTERFLKYVSIPTTSNSRKDTNPSTECQRNLAKVLIEELHTLGVDNLYYDYKNCYIYAMIKGKENTPKLGFIAHMDTSEDAKGENIKPQIIYNYDGNDIKYPNGKIMKVEDNPDLLNQIGKTLIVTDGRTLLGADDKAGIAEIMSMLEYFKSTDEPHGDIHVCFTPDEEIGRGTQNFRMSMFPVDYAYTVDGSSIGEISYENFNAATATIKIKGTLVHYGYGKDKLINAALLANKIIALLPDQTPRNTEGYEGYFHVEEIKGDTQKCQLKILIRDFDLNNFEFRKKQIEAIVESINSEYNDCISLAIEDKYYNMFNYIGKHMHLVENATKVSQELGINSIVTPMRGGTDGADLSYKGLPCPNLGTGGHNFHSIYEYISVEDMDLATSILIGISKEYSKVEKEVVQRTRRNTGYRNKKI